MKRYPNNKKARISITIPLDLYEKLKEDSFKNKDDKPISISKVVSLTLNKCMKVEAENKELLINSSLLKVAFEDMHKSFLELINISVIRKKEIDELKKELGDMDIKEFMASGIEDELNSLKLKYSELLKKIDVLYSSR